MNFYDIRELKWISEKEKRIGVDISNIGKLVDNDSAYMQDTSSTKVSMPAEQLRNTCIIASLKEVKYPKKQITWALPKRYTDKKGLKHGSKVEIFSDGKEIVLNELTKEKENEIIRKKQEEIHKIKEDISNGKKNWIPVRDTQDKGRGSKSVAKEKIINKPRKQSSFT